MGNSPIMTSYTVVFISSTFIPIPYPALACGSISTIRTLFPFSARNDARFTVVVVLPTPPFWLETDITLPIYVLQDFRLLEFPPTYVISGLDMLSTSLLICQRLINIFFPGWRNITTESQRTGEFFIVLCFA